VAAWSADRCSVLLRFLGSSLGTDGQEPNPGVRSIGRPVGRDGGICDLSERECFRLGCRGSLVCAGDVQDLHGALPEDALSTD
jgi:hypothetical protein